MINKIADLKEKRRLKFIEYSKVPLSSWVKQLKKCELDILDSMIKIENLKRRNEK